MHFINNGVVVTQMYILTKMGKPIEQAMDEKSPIWTGAIALIALYFLFRLFNKESDRVVASSNINAL
jgi:plastocyanin domain-containing protein